jgi:tetratricopeptide (TPR) repeat protein
LVWAGRATEALPWLESARRFDHGHLLTANSLCWAYYFFGRYIQAVEAADRALSRGPGRSNQMITHSFLAAAYAETGRSQDAEGERAIIMRLSPFFDARIFAG